jgi:hypothetical protein
MAEIDFLTEKRNEIGARLEELRPRVDEYHQLEAAAAALASVNGKPAATRSTSKSAPKSRRGRPKGSGTRAAEALELVKATPGISIPEIAGKMGIKQNYLYRVLPGLATDGLVKRTGRGWHPVDAA